MGPSLWQILLVVGIFVILFMGPSRLPGVGKSIGEAIRGFKKGLNDDEIDITDSSNDPNQRLSDGAKDTAAKSTAPRKKKTKSSVTAEDEDSES